MNITGAELISRFLERHGHVQVRHVAAGVERLSLPQRLRQCADLPLLWLLRQKPRAHIGADEWREVSAGGRIADATRACFHVGAAAELIELLPLAVRLANGDAPGSVVLDIPEDVLDERIEGAWIPALPAIAVTRGSAQHFSLPQPAHAH